MTKNKHTDPYTQSYTHLTADQLIPPHFHLQEYIIKLLALLYILYVYQTRNLPRKWQRELSAKHPHKQQQIHLQKLIVSTRLRNCL